MKHLKAPAKKACYYAALFALLLVYLLFPSRNGFAQHSHAGPCIPDFEFMEDDTGKVKSMYVCAFSFREENPDSGIVIAKMALKLSTSLNWEKGIALSYHAIGVNLMAKNQYGEASKYFYKAAVINGEIENNIALIQNYINIGICNYNLTDYSTSLEYYFRAKNIAENIKDSVNLSKCYNSIGNIYVVLNSCESAILSFKQAILIYTLKKDSIGMARSFHNLGTAYEKQAKFLLARKWYFTALDIHTRKNITSEIIKDLGSVASTYRNEDDIDSAIIYYFKALTLAESYGNDISLIGINLTNIVFLYIEMQAAFLKAIHSSNGAIPDISLRKLEEYSNRSVAIFEEIQNYDCLQQALDARSQLNALMGNYKGALMDRNRCVKLQDSIFTGTMMERIKQLEEKEAELKNQKKAAEVRHKDFIDKLSIAAAVFFVIGVLFLIRMLNSHFTDNFVRRYWFATFLLISGLVSLLLEPLVPAWFNHNAWQMWVAYISIPFILEQVYYWGAKLLERRRQKKKKVDSEPASNGTLATGKASRSKKRVPKKTDNPIQS